jgi:hypothetical protein
LDAVSTIHELQKKKGPRFLRVLCFGGPPCESNFFLPKIVIYSFLNNVTISYDKNSTEKWRGETNLQANLEVSESPIAILIEVSLVVVLPYLGKASVIMFNARLKSLIIRSS